MNDLDLDNPAWRFALDLYGRPGVAPECLRLQDQVGTDVSLLLFCLWLGAERGIRLDGPTLEEAKDVAEGWSALAVRPLRSVRRAVKTSPEMARPAVASFRASVQELEIASERIEIALLHAWSGRLPDASEAAGQACAAANLALVLAGAPEGGGSVRGTIMRAVAERLGPEARDVSTTTNAAEGDEP